MTIELDRETERLINEQLCAGGYRSASALVEVAVKHYLRQIHARQVRPTDESMSTAEHFDTLRRRIEQAGIPLLDDEHLRREIGDRKGVRS